MVASQSTVFNQPEVLALPASPNAPDWVYYQTPATEEEEMKME